MIEAWETEIASFLAELADVQTALLSVLSEKRAILARRDAPALAALAEREQVLVERLQASHKQRQELLALAKQQGRPADSIQSLSNSLPAEHRARLEPSLAEAAERSRFLQHQSLTNWVVVQRSLLYLSQLIEIIATGSRFKPTYGNGQIREASGALVDRAA